MTSADLFIFLVSTFLSDFEVFSNKRNDCLAQDSNPEPLACEASVLPFCHGRFLQKKTKILVLNLQVSTFLSESAASFPSLFICLPLQQLLMVLLCVHRCWFFWYYHFFVSLLPCLVLEHITSFGNTSYWHELGTFTLLRAIRYIGNKEDCKLDFREFPFPAPSQIGF